MNTKKSNIIIIEPVSSGFNYIDDVVKSGHTPIVLLLGGDSKRYYETAKKDLFKKMPKGIEIINEDEDYNKTLEKVKKISPCLVLAGSERAVPLKQKLSYDLNIMPNDPKILDSLINKNDMHLALKNAGLRYMRGKIISSVEEAKSFYDQLGTPHIVLKPDRDAAANGVHICHSWDDVKKAFVEITNTDTLIGSDKKIKILMQECIFGDEYIVNTMSINGKHRIISMWKYNFVPNSDGKIIFDSMISIGTDNASNNISQLIRYSLNALDALKFKNGPTHLELFYDEKGPILIEVNARCMGGSTPASMLETVFGYHDTGEILNSYLYHENFLKKVDEPYTTNGMGFMKFIVVPKDINVIDKPIIEIAKNLDSFIGFSFENVKHTILFHKSFDLESAGGIIYLANKNKNKFWDDMNFLCNVEKNYFNLFLTDKNDIQKLTNISAKYNENTNLASLFSLVENGATICFVDKKIDNPSIIAVTTDTIDTIKNDDYDCGIFDLHFTYSMKIGFISEYIKRFNEFCKKIKDGGRLYIPRSIFKNVPYNESFFEILLTANNFNILSPTSNTSGCIVGIKKGKQ